MKSGDASPLDPAGPVESSPATPGLTLVSGTTFCLSERGGDLSGAVHGLFARDTRVVSALRIEVGGRRPETLAVLHPAPDRATVLARIHPPAGRHDSFVLLERRRTLGAGLSETLVLRNYSTERVRTELRLSVETDFADLFAVKDGRARQRAGTSPAVPVNGAGTADWQLAPVLAYGAAAETPSAAPGAPGLLVTASGHPTTHSGALVWQVEMSPYADWTVHVDLTPEFVPEDGGTAAAIRAGAWLDPRFSVGVPAGRPSELASSGAGIAPVLARTRQDLTGLHLVLPGARMPALAAGAPWFMTLFGRDSLLAGYMALPWQPALLTGALESLAALQGRRTDARTEEQPGRILHELRLGKDSARAIGGHCYYGTADATPLFAMMVAEAWRWGLDEAAVSTLLPAVDAALSWCRTDGDRDGDGFIDYERMTAAGLQNQGWKDSYDGISDAAGAMPAYPVALCEVQAYHYRALLGRAQIAEHRGETVAAARARAEATELRDRFRARFWLPERGRPALALGAGRPLDALASNAAHCLWAGLLDDDEAERVVAGLAGPDMNTGWGLRTLSADMGAYNPMSYHNGSVWPHETALAVAGLTAYRHIPGALDLAYELARGLMHAAEAFGGRLPELLCGFAREQYPVPVPYPTSCSPQAWSSAAPLLVLRALLGLHPDVPARTVALDPCLPSEWGEIQIADLALGAVRVTVDAAGSTGSITGLPAGWDVTPDARRLSSSGR